MKLIDSTRDGQEISFTLWLPVQGDQPDLSGAPYPVIIYSHGGDISDGMVHRYDNNGLLDRLAGGELTKVLEW